MVYVPAALKLHAFGLGRLQDPNWTGMNLFDYVKQHVRGRREPIDLLRKPLEIGLLFYLGCWLYDEYFLEDHIESLEGEYQAWYLEDAVELLKFHAPEARTSLALKSADELLQRVNDIYDSGEDRYFALLDHLHSYGTLVEQYEELLSEFASVFNSNRPHYAANYADRVLHDRQLCAYISQLLLTIGFDGDDDGDGVPKPWVERVAWPERVKAILRARDRGACSQCGTNIVIELNAEPHIDHIVPLARGGTNDLVNLQLLCATCNQRKYTNDVDVYSSIPEYIRRGRAT